MEKQTQTQKQNNADKLEDISLEIKSILRQTTEIRSDLSYIKAYLDIKKPKTIIDPPDSQAPGWWWG
tara:strand:+ start:338 stop:538 length:201 start_codon:yes stop_codon:yes gene_type:complete